MKNPTKDFKIKIFADGADEETMFEMNNCDFIGGLTTNPTLMRNSGISNYPSFCKTILKKIIKKPISFEVFADDFKEMERQAKEISSWGDNVYVKIPITNTKQEKSIDLVSRLTSMNIKLNITALMTNEQVKDCVDAIKPGVPCYISVFAGRIADTGIDPIPMMTEALEIMSINKSLELIWASPRELLNIIQANDIGCHVITVTNDIIKKLKLIGYNLDDYSLDTVKMFYDDAKKSGYTLNVQSNHE